MTLKPMDNLKRLNTTIDVQGLCLNDNKRKNKVP